jgi:excisionase family DNA binding protein
MNNEKRLAEMVGQEVCKILSPVLQELLSMPQYVTLKRAAELTEFSYDFLYDAVTSGDLPATKKGRNYRVAVSDLKAWMERDRDGNHIPSRPQLSESGRRHFPGLFS